MEALKSGVIERLRTQLTEVLRLEANARTTLGPQHPAYREIREQIVETRRQITEELNRIAEGARSAYQVAQSNVVSLEKQLDQLKREATARTRPCCVCANSSARLKPRRRFTRNSCATRSRSRASRSIRLRVA